MKHFEVISDDEKQDVEKEEDVKDDTIDDEDDEIVLEEDVGVDDDDESQPQKPPRERVAADSPVMGGPVSPLVPSHASRGTHPRGPINQRPISISACLPAFRGRD